MPATRPTAADVKRLVAEQRSVANGEDSLMFQGPERRILDTIERLCLSWRKGYESEQRGALNSDYRKGMMGQSAFAISLLLGLPTSTPVAEALLESKGHL